MWKLGLCGFRCRGWRDRIQHDTHFWIRTPEAVDDYVGADNPVRFIDAFVDELDLSAAGFVRVAAKATGRPGYSPADLLKLYIYGYLNRVRSSRRLEMECHRNIEVIWLLRTLKPDFKTIADFRSDNRAAFRSVFRQFVLLCRRLDLFGRELLAVDGTRIKAVNNKDRNFTRNSLEKFIRAADERLDEYLRCLDEGDVTEAGTGGARTKNLAEKIEALRKKRGRYGAMLAELERTGESQISLTDPDSRAMAAHRKAGVGYNIQIAVDAKNKMIVEQAVTNQVVDMGLLKETAEPARAILDVENIDVVADRGYFKIEDIEACEKAGLTPYVPKPQRGSSVRNGFFRKDEFRYESQAAGFEKDRLQQSGGMPFLSSSVALHHRPSPGLASGERGGAGPHGRPPEGEAGNPRPASRDRRASLRQYQAMDEPGRIPDEGPRQGAGGVQPDRARLQSAASAQHPWRRGHDGGRPGVKTASNRAQSRLDAARGATGDFLDQNAQNALPRVARRRALIWDGSFHTVCKNSAPVMIRRDTGLRQHGRTKNHAWHRTHGPPGWSVRRMSRRSRKIRSRICPRCTSRDAAGRPLRIRPSSHDSPRYSPLRTELGASEVAR